MRSRWQVVGGERNEMKKRSEAKIKLRDGHRRVDMQRALVLMCQRSRKKYVLGFGSVFKAVRPCLELNASDLEINHDSGEPFYYQDVRNVAKPAKSAKSNHSDAVSRGELLVIVGGGFALPDAVLPKGIKIKDSLILHKPSITANAKAAKAGSYRSPFPPMGAYDRELFECLQEECSEIIHRASKALRFSLLEKQPGQKLTNKDRLSDEVGDLLCLVTMCEDRGLLDSKRIGVAMKAKVKKLHTYMQHKPD